MTHMTYLDEPQDHARMPDHSDRSDRQVTSLAEKAVKGDNTAFEELVNLFHKEIFRMVYYRTRSRMDAEDLTQDIFLQAFRNLPGLKDLDRFRAWLFRIAVNRVRDFHRKRRFLSFFRVWEREDEPEQFNIEDQSNAGALDQLMRQEFWSQVEKLSSTFSPVEQEVFFLRFLDHLSIKEIARVLNKSESAVKTHLYRSLRKFREDAVLLQLLQEDMP